MERVKFFLYTSIPVSFFVVILPNIQEKLTSRHSFFAVIVVVLMFFYI